MTTRIELGREACPLPVELSEREWAKRVNELARMVDEIEEAEEHLETLRARWRVLSRAVRRREEIRPVEVVLYAETREGTVVYVRADTGEEIKRRHLRPEDVRKLQVPLFEEP